MAIADFEIDVTDLPAAWITAGHTNLVPNDATADNSTFLTALLADVTQLDTGSPNAVTEGVVLKFPPGHHYYFKDTVLLDIASNVRPNIGLTITGGGGILRNMNTSNSTRRSFHVPILIAGKVTFAAIAQPAGIKGWQVKLGTRNDGLAEADGKYNFRKIEITAGTGVGQVRQIWSYDNDTRIATLTQRWTIPPDSTSTYTIYGGPIFRIRSAQGLWLNGLCFAARDVGSTSDILGNRPGSVAIAHGNIDGIASQWIMTERCSFHWWDVGFDNNSPLYENEQSNTSEILFRNCLWLSGRTGFRCRGTGALGMSFDDLHFIAMEECLCMDGGGQINVRGMTQVVSCKHVLRRTDSGSNLVGCRIHGVLKIDSLLPRCTLYEEIPHHRYGVSDLSGIVIGTAQNSFEPSSIGSSAMVMGLIQSPDNSGKCRITLNGYRREMAVGRKISFSGFTESSYNAIHGIIMLPDAKMIHSGTAVSSGSNYINLAAGASATTDIYTGYNITLTAGKGRGVVRPIAFYDGSLKRAYLGKPPSAETLNTGTAQASSSTTYIDLDPGTASGTNDAYTGALITITGGTGSGQRKRITDYVGSSKRATIAGTFSPAPDGTSTYEVSKIIEGDLWTDGGGGTHDPDTTTQYEIRAPWAECVHAGAVAAVPDSTHVDLNTGASATNDAYNGWQLRLTSGSASPTNVMVVDYDGATKRCTVTPAFSVNPAVGNLFEMRGTFIDTDISYVSDDLTRKEFGIDNSTTEETVAQWKDQTPIVQVRGGHVVIEKSNFAASMTGKLGFRVSATQYGGSGSAGYGSTLIVRDCKGLSGPPNSIDPIASYLDIVTEGTAPANWYLLENCTASGDGAPMPWTLGNFGMGTIFHAGLATAGGASTITLDSSAPAVTELFKENALIAILAGTGAGQARLITAYTSGRVATVTPNWIINPDATSFVHIIPAGYIPALAPQAKADVNAEADAALTDINLDHWMKNAITGADVTDNSGLAKLVSKSATADWDTFINTTDSLEALSDTGGGSVTVGPGGITASSFAANAIDGNALAASALAEINAEVDQAIIDARLDHLAAVAVTGADVADNSIFAKLVSKSATADWDSFNNATDSLEALSDTGGGSVTVGPGGITASSFAANAIDGNAVAASAVTEIQAGLTNVLFSDATSEVAVAPTATAAFGTKLLYAFQAIVNQNVVSATQRTISKSDNTVCGTATLSDSAGNFTQTRFS